MTHNVGLWFRGIRTEALYYASSGKNIAYVGNIGIDERVSVPPKSYFTAGGGDKNANWCFWNSAQ